MDKRNLQRLLKFFLILGDIFFIIISVLITYYLRFYLNFIPVRYGIPELKYYLYLIPFLIIFYLITFNYAGLYREIEKKSNLDIFFKVLISTTFAIILVLSFSFFIREITYSRILMLSLWILSFIIISFWRIIYKNFYHFLYKKEFIITRVILIGMSELSKMFIERVQREPASGYKIAGILDKNNAKDFYGVKYLGNINNLSNIIKEYNIDEVFIGLPDFDREKLTELILENDNVQFKIASDILGIIVRDIDYDEIFGIPVFCVKELPLDKLRNRIIKRTIDIIISLIGLILLLPLFIIIGIIIKLTSEGPVFYKQERLSRGGKIFNMYKFRTMKKEAEKHTGPVWAKKDDDRVTAIGKFLRKTSIDELPQLINILKGDMSVVGPRPERPYFVKKFKETIPKYIERHKVKAGLTGWAQVNGLRGNTSLEERVKYDLYYIQNWSVWFDIKIIIQTILEIFHHKHAY